MVIFLMFFLSNCNLPLIQVSYLLKKDSIVMMDRLKFLMEGLYQSLQKIRNQKIIYIYLNCFTLIKDKYVTSKYSIELSFRRYNIVNTWGIKKLKNNFFVCFIIRGYYLSGVMVTHTRSHCNCNGPLLQWERCVCRLQVRFLSHDIMTWISRLNFPLI